MSRSEESHGVGVNSYSGRWFELFLRPIDPRQTAREIAFLCRQLPPERCRTVVDVCCGPGRHAHLLAAAGYTVTGVDRDAPAVADARARALSNETYLQHDMRRLPDLGLHADAVLCLWQSFGYFDAVTNRAILGDMAAMLPARGRCILDLYHHDFFAERQGTRTSSLREHRITETKRVENGRMFTTLVDGNGAPIDMFEWQLFTPVACIALARSVGLACVLTCTNYDEQQSANKDLPRAQYVFEKTPRAPDRSASG